MIFGKQSKTQRESRFFGRKVVSGLALGAALLTAGAAISRAQESPNPQVHPAPTPSPMEGPQAFVLNDGAVHLGVTLDDVTPDQARELKLPEVAGAIVGTVQKDSAAAKAGLQAGDTIVEFDGDRVRSSAELRRMVRETPAGRTVAIKVVRKGKTQVLSATLEAAPNHFSFNTPPIMPPMDFGEFSGPAGAHRASLGISADDLTPQLAKFFGVKQGNGVLISEVTKGGPADRAGLLAGDVIVKVDGSAVSGLEDLRAELNEEFKGETRKVTLTIVRDHHEQTVAVELTRFQIWEHRTSQSFGPELDQAVERARQLAQRARVQAEVLKQQKFVDTEWQRELAEQMKQLQHQLQQRLNIEIALYRDGEI